ncbi:MAG: hypothetical protein A3G81_31105 [Betaproteobacteria bacterium RIFCSPLOWO2_12_FULL_65_14]|nr:MAG: hypothetical protein A3G81_31105 [Betaproteobacteria bacterium RIFCSPLOWO2_12_FULL_65_14]
MEPTVLFVPGLRGSGPAHWQSLWLAKHPEYRRVLQHDWLAPRLEDWAAAINGAIRAARPCFVVAHGFGCVATLARFAEQSSGVAGALLVAPRDPAQFGLELEELALPTTLVASRNDSDMAFRDAARMARRLGSRFVDAGEAGHIDAASGYGPWPRGERLLQRLIAKAQARERELRIALALAA